MEKPFMLRVFEADNDIELSEKALNYYIRLILDNVVNDSLQMGNPFLVVALRSVAMKLECDMHPSGKKIVQELLSHCEVVDLNKEAYNSEADNVSGSN